MSVTLLRLSSRCPSCGRAEARRIYPWVRGKYEVEDPELPVATVQCKCGTRYLVQAKHYQAAEAER